MKPFTVSDQHWDQLSLEVQRQNIIQLRNSALKEGMMDWAVILSHQIALLAHFISIMEES